MFKRVGFIAAVAGVGVAVFWAAGWLMLRRTPDWYRPDRSTPEQRRVAARAVETKLVALYNWMAASRAAEARGNASAAPSQGTITFSNQELNSFFNKWSDFDSRRDFYSKYIDAPRIILRDQQLILAGTVKELGLVVSMQFEPKIDEQGNLRMNLVHVLGGMLPLPDAMWSGQREKVGHLLRRKLEILQEKASLNAAGIANGAAGSVILNKLLWAVLHDRPADPVLCLPFDATNLGRTMPVRVTAIDVKDGQITLSAEQLDPTARAKVRASLSQPYPEAVPPPPSSVSATP